MFTLDIDLSEYNRASTRYLSTLSAGAQRATRDAAASSQARIASGAYWTNRTGKTGRSFRIDADPEALGATLVSNSKVARFLESGTRPHVITPRRKDALRFVPAGGGAVFARSVNHPGTKPRNYLAAEASASDAPLTAAVERAADAAASASGLD